MHTIDRPVIRAAAAMLATDPGEATDAADSEAARRLLADLGAFDGTGPGNLAALVRLAGRLPMVFTLAAPRAPGLTFLGATVDAREFGRNPSGYAVDGVSGSGTSLRTAFAACIGEAAEYLSQLESGDEGLARRPAGEPGGAPALRNLDGLLAQLEATPGRADPGADPAIDWIAAERATDGAAVLVPADLCLRGRDQSAVRSRIPLSTGCAAGPTAAGARLSAVLELVERDAAALWWIGGRRGRRIAPDSTAGRALPGLLRALRHDREERRTFVLDITTDLAIPCVAALSCNRDGRDLAFGLAARLDVDAAVRSALVEMCQGELGNGLIGVKLARGGEAALTDRERLRARRSRDLVYDDCPLLHPAGVSRSDDPVPPAGDPLGHVLTRLADADIDVAFVDLTRQDVDIPVIKAFAPGLQPLQSCIATRRLQRTRDEFGGGMIQTDSFALL